MIGEADTKSSVKGSSLTDDHKGENLLYQREVIELCPFRIAEKSFIYSFLTNNRQLLFLRSSVTTSAEDGTLILKEEASQEVDMETGWPYLWQLLNATPEELGHSLPIVTIDGASVLLESVIGVGAQGVCYAGTFNSKQVVIKLSTKFEELHQERLVLGALCNKSEIATASVEAAANCGANGKPFCDGEQVLDEAAQRCLPSVVAYGTGVLILGSVGKDFGGTCTTCCLHP